MKSDSYWRIFTLSGDPDAYLQYKKCKRTEERLKAMSEFAEFEELSDADNNGWDSDKGTTNRREG